MTRIIPPDDFVRAFDQTVTARHSEVGSLWDSSKDYSELFLDRERGMLPEVARALGLTYWREYRGKIDAVYYEPVEDVERVAVAIEHENHSKWSVEEIDKLSLLNVPLKVLITYPNGPSDEDKLLRSYSRRLGAVDVFDDFASLRRHVIAFAFKSGSVISWRYHVYTDPGFVPLRP